VVVGAPDGMVDHRERFEKSFLWKTPSTDGTRHLGTAAGLSNEAFWDVRGGSMRLTHVNPSTGGEVSFNMRINHRDELEFVRRTMTPAGVEAYEQVLRVGQKRFGEKVGGNADDVGSVAFTSVTRRESGRGFDFTLSSFHTYDRYELIVGLYNQFDDPRSEELVAERDSGTNANVVSFSDVVPDAVQASVGAVTNLFISPPSHGLLDNVPYVVAAVIRDTATGRYTAKPFTSIVYHLADPGSIGLTIPSATADGSIAMRTPIDISIALSGTGLSASAAIINTTKTLFDWFMQDNPTLLAGSAQATTAFLQFVSANYSAYISFAYAGVNNSWLAPEPGKSVATITTSPPNLEEVKFLRHLDLLVDSAGAPSVVLVLLPLAFTVEEPHRPSGAVPVDQYGRDCGYVRVHISTQAVSYLTGGVSGSPYNAYVSLPASKTASNPDASLLDNTLGHRALAAGGAASAWSALIDHVTDYGVWRVPLDWAQAPVAHFGLPSDWAS
jgi:hypothetical protein